MAFDVLRLAKKDVEALAALKLVEELGLGAEAASELLAKVDEGWMRRFLTSGPPAIGSEMLGFEVLMRARVYRSRSRLVRSNG